MCIEVRPTTVLGHASGNCMGADGDLSSERSVGHAASVPFGAGGHAGSVPYGEGQRLAPPAQTPKPPVEFMCGRHDIGERPDQWLGI
jgi:hypothetical protein